MRIMAPISYILALSLAGCGRGSNSNPAIMPLPTLDPARMNTGNSNGKRISDAQWQESNRLFDGAIKDTQEIVLRAKTKEELMQLRQNIEATDMIQRQSIYDLNPSNNRDQIDILKKRRARLNELYAQVQRRLAEF